MRQPAKDRSCHSTFLSTGSLLLLALGPNHSCLPTEWPLAQHTPTLNHYNLQLQGSKSEFKHCVPLVVERVTELISHSSDDHTVIRIPLSSKIT